MDSLDYIKTQAHRMNDDQIGFVMLMDELPAGSAPTKTDSERIAQLYLWLHMDKGSIEHRRFSSSVSLKGRRKR